MNAIVDDAEPLIAGLRLNGNLLRVVCPYCRDRKGRPRFHTHGTGGDPGPWHRLSHCADSELLPRYRGQRFLSYEIVELAEPRVVAPPLVPFVRKPKRAPALQSTAAKFR